MGMQEQEEDIEVSMEEENSGRIPVGSSPDDFRILEAVLFASDELLTAAHLKSILPGQPDARKIRGMVEKINVQLQKERHPFEVVEIGGGYQFRTITYYHPWVRQIFKEKASKKLSIQALECLAIIAYKQPISKAEIEAVRGVVSDGAMKTLLEKRLVTVSGRSDKPGRPLLYGTTQTFLTYFGLNKIEDLPRIEEFEAMAREKMEDLSIDELAAPQTVSDEEPEAGTDRKEFAAAPETPVPPPVESSVFEMEITPDSKPVAPLQTDAAIRESVKNDDVVEVLATVAPSPAAANTVKSDGSGDGEDTVPIDTGKLSDDSCKAAVPEADTAEPASSPAGTAENGKVMDPFSQPEVTDTPAETAFDLESMVDDEHASIDKAKKDRRSELEGIVLRGETAFDLEAIVIEDPQINFPPSYKKTSSGQSAKKTVVSETAFDIDLMPKAPPKKRTSENAGTLPVQKPEAGAADKTAPTSDMPEVGKKIIVPYTESVFELNAPFATSDAATPPDDGKSIASSRSGDSHQTPSVKPDETACFEVGASSGFQDDPAACEMLEEELKETAIFMPDGAKKSISGQSVDHARKTGDAKNGSRKEKSENNNAKLSSGKPSPDRTDAPEQSDNT